MKGADRKDSTHGLEILDRSLRGVSRHSRFQFLNTGLDVSAFGVSSTRLLEGAPQLLEGLPDTSELPVCINMHLFIATLADSLIHLVIGTR